MTLVASPLALTFPAIDPVLIEIGPFAIRWYSLAWIAGLIVGWRYMLRRVAEPGTAMTAKDVDDLLVWVTLGVVLGGRLGYVLFYNSAYYFANPGDIIAVWRGGMSFHGGVLGIVLAVALFARKRGLKILAITDLGSLAAPIGLFFGRLANFVNGELYGRPSDVPWAMVFPGGGPLARHPSQLYEAALEGVVLFALLWYLARRTDYGRRAGVVTGAFFAGYALARLFVELFRQPDAHIGFLLGGSTMGQFLSLPLLAVGLTLIVRARRHG